MEKRDLLQLLKDIRPQIDAALKEVAKKNGLERLTAGNVSYSNGGSFTFKLEGVVSGGLTKDQDAYVMSHNLLNLPPRETELTINRQPYKTDGLNHTGSKVIMLCVADGKRYLFKIDDIVRIAEKEGKVKLPEVSVAG